MAESINYMPESVKFMPDMLNETAERIKRTVEANNYDNKRCSTLCLYCKIHPARAG